MTKSNPSHKRKLSVQWGERVEEVDKDNHLTPVDMNDVETIDLVDLDDLQVSQLISNQRERERGTQETQLAGMTCIICMEEPTDLSILPCGHPFCDLCVRQYFRSSGPTGTSGKCPVCRKKVATRNIVPLEIKLRA